MLHRKLGKLPTSLLPRKSGKTFVKELIVKGSSVTNPAEMSNVFYNHFSTIGSKLASEIPLKESGSHLHYLTGTDNTFQFQQINSNQVLSLIKI